MNYVKYNFSYMFIYSHRIGTYTYKKLIDNVSLSTKKRRLTEIINLQKTHSYYRNRKYIGSIQNILIKKKLSEIFNRELIHFPYRKLIIITKVIVNSDFSLATIYISFFPKENKYNLIKIINYKSKYYEKKIFKKLRFKFKKMPNIFFKIDDSL